MIRYKEIYDTQRTCKIVLAKSQLLRDLRDHLQKNFPKTKKEVLVDVREYRASFIQRRRDITVCSEIYERNFSAEIAATLPYQSQPKAMYDELQASCITESGEKMSSLKEMAQDIYIKRFPTTMKVHRTEDSKMQRGRDGALEVMRAGYHGIAESVISYIDTCGGDAKHSFQKYLRRTMSMSSL